MRASRRGAHCGECSVHHARTVKTLEGAVAVSAGVHVDVEYVQSVAGGDADVRLGLPCPPAADAPRVGGRITVAALGQRLLAARATREHVEAGCRVH